MTISNQSMPFEEEEEERMSGLEMTTEEEVTVSEILLELHKLFSSAAASESPAATLLPRWGKKRKRSVPIEDERRRSPATPLAFSPSEDTNPFSFPQPPKKIFRKMAHHKKWVDEQNGRIDSLSSARADLQRSVEEARCRYRMLAEKNCWLKHHLEQQKMNHELVRQRHHQQQQRRILDLFQVGPTNQQQQQQQQQQQRWQVRQQRLLLSAQARKRRKDLQRAKSSSISSASAANDKVPLATLSCRIKTTRDSTASRHFASRKFSSPHT